MGEALFGGALARMQTPQQRQEQVMRLMLETRRDFWAHTDKDYVYRGAGDLLLLHGKPYVARPLPAEYEHLRGEPAGCFLNALNAVRADPSLRYVEGVYTVGSGGYAAHAWAIDPAGELLELTYPSDPELFEALKDQIPVRVSGDISRWGYWGVILHPDYVQATMDAQGGKFGVLDRPSLEGRGGNTMLTEWRTAWPIYSVPYDPERKELP